MPASRTNGLYCSQRRHLCTAEKYHSPANILALACIARPELLAPLRILRRRARAHKARLARLARRDALPVPAARVRRVPARVRARVARRDRLDGFAGARQRQRALLRLALAVSVLMVVGWSVGGGDGDDGELDVVALCEVLEDLAERLVGFVHLLVVRPHSVLQ